MDLVTMYVLGLGNYLTFVKYVGVDSNELNRKGEKIVYMAQSARTPL
jgi:hypothetical protein